MPAKSKSQQSAAAMALRAKRGEIPVSKLKGAAKDMYENMSENQLEDFAKTKTKNLPESVDEYVVSKNVKIVLNENEYMLEAGDKIIVNPKYYDKEVENPVKIKTNKYI